MERLKIISCFSVGFDSPFMQVRTQNPAPGCSGPAREKIAFPAASFHPPALS
jgi:hypothetical protein